ncbi:TPA: hypothetical protein ACQUHH_005588 [Bacillus mobilis]
MQGLQGQDGPEGPTGPGGSGVLNGGYFFSTNANEKPINSILPLEQPPTIFGTGISLVGIDTINIVVAGIYQINYYVFGNSSNYIGTQLLLNDTPIPSSFIIVGAANGFDVTEVSNTIILNIPANSTLQLQVVNDTIVNYAIPNQVTESLTIIQLS